MAHLRPQVRNAPLAFIGDPVAEVTVAVVRPPLQQSLPLKPCQVAIERTNVWVGLDYVAYLIWRQECFGFGEN